MTQSHQNTVVIQHENMSFLSLSFFWFNFFFFFKVIILIITFGKKQSGYVSMIRVIVPQPVGREPHLALKPESLHIRGHSITSTFYLSQNHITGMLH